MIQVTVNGKAHRFERPVEVAALLSTLNLVGKKVAVERNGEIVPRSAHASTVLADGDQLEIVVAVAEADSARRTRHRRQVLPLAPAGRHRQVPRLRADARRGRRLGRRDRHRGDPPHQHRPERERAEPARRAAAVRSTPIFRTPPAATARPTRCARCASRASCSTGTIW
jgi:sulfur carrier protein